MVDSKKNLDPREKLDDGGNGFYTQTCEDIAAIRNIFLGCEGSGIVHHYVEEAVIGGGSGQSARLFTILENIISDSARHVTLPEEHNTVDGNIAPLRMLMPVSHHDLKHWQKNFGFDLQGKEENIAYTLEDDKLLTLTIGNKTFAIDLTTDIVPQIDAIFA